MIERLAQIASELDKEGLITEANLLDESLMKLAEKADDEVNVTVTMKCCRRCLDDYLDLFAAINSLGATGASRAVTIFVDGDGSSPQNVEVTVGDEKITLKGRDWQHLVDES